MADYTQGRIRLNEEGALELREALERHEVFLLDVRDEVASSAAMRRDLNRRVGSVRRILRETNRLIGERGWSQEDQDGELQRPDAQAAG